MKKYINYYYNLSVNNIYFRDSKYFFTSDNNNYILELCNNMIISEYYNDLIKQIAKNPFFSTIVINKDGNLITVIDNKPYVLLKVKNISNEEISIFDIKNNLYVDVTGKLNIINHFPWIKLWERKIDNLEDWFLNKTSKYKELYALFNYYIGISENALLYLKQTLINEQIEESDNLMIQHSRVGVNTSLYEYYDPINIIIDHHSRDISEYVKSSFLNYNWDIRLLDDYLKKNHFSRYGLMVMYSRILFPSFFFDYLDKMISENKNIDLLYLESRTNEFQDYLKQISNFFVDKYNIEPVEWIIKKT